MMDKNNKINSGFSCSFFVENIPFAGFFISRTLVDFLYLYRLIYSKQKAIFSY